jgi:beta-lactamase superfamily II metal-dependent hydrolase
MRAICVALATCAAAACGHDAHDEECQDSYEAYATVVAPAAVPAGSFGYVQLDVGQGDAAVVVAPSGCAALLDGGPTGAGNAVIKASLAALGVTALDFAVVSHFHADHIGGLDEVVTGTDGVPIAQVYDRGGSYSSATFDAYASQFAGSRTAVNAGDAWSLCGEVAFQVVASDGNSTSTTNENARSVAVKVSFGAFDALVGGDLTGSSPDIESSVAPGVGEVELYKVHHHGSATSTNATLVAALVPTVSLIPVGANNPYGHPDPGTVARLDAAGSAIWQTEDPATGSVLGHITVVSADGAAFEVQQGGRTASYTARGDTPPPPPPPPACDVAITQLQYSKRKSELLVRATSSQQPAATLTASADGTPLGEMTFVASRGYYELRATIARPACVTATASCGAAATSCL